MYVVAVGIGDYAEKGLNLNYPAKDARALAELLRARGGKLYDRVDVVPVLDRDATRATIEDTVKDVAELTRPQDTLVVLLCGHGALVGDRVYFAPHDLRTGTDRPEDALRKRGVAVDDIAAAMGTAPALSRVLVVDAASSGEVFGGALKGRSEFGLRGAVERWGRSHGVHALAAVAATNRAVERPELGRGLLAQSLLDAAGGDAVDVTDWFRSAAERADLVDAETHRHPPGRAGRHAVEGLPAPGTGQVHSSAPARSLSPKPTAHGGVGVPFREEFVG